MGGFFSSPDPPVPVRTSQPIRTYSPSTPSSYHYSEPAMRPRPSSVNSSIRSPSYAPQYTQRATYTQFPRPQLSSAVLRKPLAMNWQDIPSNKSFTYANVTPYSQEYITVEQLFSETCKGKNFEVQSIKKVQNPYLLGCYMLKKEEMSSRHDSIKELHVFHGTSEKNLDNISKNNFNWRVVKEHMFGQGISFSPISYYASHYCDNNAHIKTMFLVKILVGNVTEGRRNMTIPPVMAYTNEMYDTTANQEGKVIVKFADNEFYPEFIIYYTGDIVPRARKGNRDARSHKGTPRVRGLEQRYTPDFYLSSYDYY